jgi:hypothetical protein
MHGFKFTLDLFFFEGKQAPNDGGDALGVPRDEGPDDDSVALWQKDNLVAVDGKGGHVEAERVGSAVIISARAMWKAKVDSAP